MSIDALVVIFSKQKPMMMPSNENILRVKGYLCGNSPVTSEFSSQGPVTRSFDGSFDLRLNKTVE